MSDAPHAQDDGRSELRFRLALGAILAVAAGIRFGQLDAQSLTMDEVKDLQLARGGAAGLITSEDRFPPLYHALLGGWLKTFPGDATGRGFSALCGVLTVGAMAGLGRTLGGSAAGLWSAGLTAVAPLPTWYSIEARAYGLYLLLGAVALWQFAAAMSDGRRRHWAAFAAAAIAGAYTHYYFGLLIALSGLVFLCARPRAADLMRGLTAFAMIAVATAPSLWLLQRDLDQPWGHARHSKFSPAGLAYTYFSYASGYTLGPSLRSLHTDAGSDAVLRAAPWAAGVGAATAALVGLALASAPRDRRWQDAAALAVFTLAPPAIIGGVSAAAGFGYNVRHVVWACLPLLAFMGVGAARGRPRWLAADAAVVLAGAFGVAHWNRLTASDHANEDVRSAARFIAKQPSAPVFVLAGYMADPLAIYLPGDWPVTQLPEATTNDNLPPAATAATCIRGALPSQQRFWLVYTRQFHGDPDGAILANLRDEFSLTLEREFAGLRLYAGAIP